MAPPAVVARGWSDAPPHASDVTRGGFRKRRLRRAPEALWSANIASLYSATLAGPKQMTLPSTVVMNRRPAAAARPSQAGGASSDRETRDHSDGFSVDRLAPSQENTEGVRCPKCGCGHFGVSDTRRAGGGLRRAQTALSASKGGRLIRRRELVRRSCSGGGCRNCGKRFSTWEQEAGR